MKKKCLRNVTKVVFISLMLTLIVQAENINIVEAKGINIIKHEMSTSSIPVDQEKLEEMYTQYRSSTTEMDKAFYLEEMNKYENELQEWYDGISDPEKEEEVREKQDLLEEALRDADLTEEGKES